MKINELNENKKHGTPDFPFQYYFINNTHPRYIMLLHWHREFEIIRIISGSFKLYLDNVEYNLKAGDVSFIGCGIMHRGEPENCVYECIVFDLNMLSRNNTDRITHLILPIIKGDNRINCYLSPDNSVLYAVVSSLFSLSSNRTDYYEMSIYGELFHLFALLYKTGNILIEQKNRKAEHRTKAMTDTIKWIDSHFTENISLSQISAVAGLNEKYLCHIFKEYTNRTPIDYINYLRIEKACHEMAFGGLTVTESALESGFNDLSYFSKIFKKQKGMTPREYRALNKI